jgi:hypothetical protein
MWLCACVGFVMCGCVCGVCVGFVMCGSMSGVCNV